MLKKALILVLAGIMIFSSFAVLASDLPVSTHLYNTSPAASSAGCYYGNLVILPDGHVASTGSSPYPLTQMSNVFSLTENVNGTITDQMNGSTVNGNGFTVNGGSNTAIMASNVTGLTIENLAIVNSSSGIQFNFVYNSFVDNVTIDNIMYMTMVSVYYSGNVTIENSNFLFVAPPTSSYGIYAEYDSTINVSFNKFSGNTWGDFAYFEEVGQLNAWGNSVNSKSSNNPTGFYFKYGGNAVFADNYINNTNEAINVEFGQYIASMNNYISNSSYGLDISYVSTYSSYNDTAVFCYYPLDLEYLGNAVIQYGNFSNFSDYLWFDACNYVTVENSTLSSAPGSYGYGIYSESGLTLNLTNDQIAMGTANDAYAVVAEYMSGWVNLANDYVYAPNGEGLYVDEDSPQFNVTNSYFNTSYGIDVDSCAIFDATISGNTFIGPTMEYAVYLDVDDMYNVNVSNNNVQSPNSSWGSGGIDLEMDTAGSNITIAHNTITNNTYPISMDSYEYGSNVIIRDNTIVNSKDAIDAGYYSSNTIITGNKIINVSDEGIYVYNEAPNTNISYNLVENMPGFGSMKYAFYIEYLFDGNNMVSHNTVLNPGSSADGIYVYDCSPVLVYSNTVNGGENGFYVKDNGPISFFNNTASNAGTGIYSLENVNFFYYGNTVSNANCSFYSNQDGGGSVFANTFSDSQANNLSLYFLDVENYTAITFYHNNFLNSTTDSITHNYFVNASGPLFMNDPLPTGGNYWSNYTSTGTNGIGNIPMNVTGTIQDLYPLTSEWTSPTVTFIENGLASGTSWSASLGGSQKTSTGNTIVFCVNNGQYMNIEYEIGSVAGYTLSVSSSSVYLNGASSTVTVTFTPQQYKVTFTQSVLPGNTSWSVTLNGNTEASSTGSIIFNEANGAYNYSIASVNGYHLASGTGTITVSGNSQTVSVKFLPNTYTLTVVETGLPAGDYWNFTINGQNYSTNSTTLTVQVATGNYTYNVSGPVGYTVSPQSANVTVNGDNATIFVHFSAQKTTSAVTGGTGKVLEGLGIGVLIMVILGIAGSFLITGKFPWDLIRKK